MNGAIITSTVLIMLLVYMLRVLCLIVCDQFGDYAIDLGSYVCYLLVHHETLVWFHVLQLMQEFPEVDL